jgi:anti-sigma B factor antagonist
MQIEERAVDAVTILELKGKLTLGDGDTLLKDKIHSLINQDCKHIVLDLGGVSYVDSAGLGEIVGSLTTVTRGGGTLKLLNLNKRIQDLMVMTKLITVFDTFDTEAEAVRSFVAKV